MRWIVHCENHCSLRYDEKPVGELDKIVGLATKIRHDCAELNLQKACDSDSTFVPFFNVRFNLDKLGRGRGWIGRGSRSIHSPSTREDERKF